MLSPTMTVFVLAVLWLIVVVPMILRTSDEHRRDRSVAGFGRTMRALGKRGHIDQSHVEVFVASQPDPSPASPRRRAVPAAQEALMYPVDRSEMSEARTAMMSRRRRSLGILIGGTVIFTLLGLIMGGIVWALAVVFALGFVGYLLFLRNQALRDRARRTQRQRRHESAAAPESYDATEADDRERFVDVDETVVRIDDEDLELHNMDTIDLTGLYQEDEDAPAEIRRAS